MTQNVKSCFITGMHIFSTCVSRCVHSSSPHSLHVPVLVLHLPAKKYTNDSYKRHKTTSDVTRSQQRFSRTQDAPLHFSRARIAPTKRHRRRLRRIVRVLLSDCPFRETTSCAVRLKPPTYLASGRRRRTRRLVFGFWFLSKGFLFCGGFCAVGLGSLPCGPSRCIRPPASDASL